MVNVAVVFSENGGALIEDRRDILVNYTEARASFRADVREVDAVLYISVQKKILDLGRRHNRAVILGFGRGCTEVGDRDRVLHFERFVVREICDVASDFSAFERRGEIAVIDKSASRKIDDADAVLAFCDRIRVYE